MMRGDEDYYMDDDEDDGGGSLIIPSDDDDSDDDSDAKVTKDDIGGVVIKTDESAYKGAMSAFEIKMLVCYDNIRALTSKITKQTDWVATMFDVCMNVIASNPTNTSQATIQTHTMEAMNMQGKSRILSTAYNPLGLMSSEDVDEEFTKMGDGSTSSGMTEDARNQIARFIDYLAKRDLSKDNLSNKKRKRRHIPAFIIFLFSAGMYDLIIDCPTMPDLYKREIDNSFKQITRAKLDLVERLARAYEERNRPKVAERVRSMGIAWFAREPAEIKTLTAYSDLGITSADVMTYKEYKSKFTNTSKAITQEVMSKLVAVYQEDGTFETLKDKTRQDAVDEVKELFAEWSKGNPVDSEMAKQIIHRQI